MTAIQNMAVFEHGGNIYDEINPAADFCQWLDFSANINPLGLPITVKNTIKSNIEALVHYPDPDGKELKKELCKHYSIKQDTIILGNGAVELLYVYVHTRKPKRVLIPVPAFSEYERAAMSGGAEIVYFYLNEEDDFSVNIDKLILNLDNINAIMLGNPNNPTGKLIAKKHIIKLVEKAEKLGIDVLVDESFLDFRQDRINYTVMDLVEKYSNLIVLQSLTKFYALPGLRLGFAVVDKNLKLIMDKNKDPWNVNLLAQKSGVAALQDICYQEKSRIIIAKEIMNLTAKLKKIPQIKVFEPSVNFILLNIKKTGVKSSELRAKMRQQGVLIRDCSNYPGLNEYYIRVAVRSASENEQMLNKLEVALNG